MDEGDGAGEESTGESVVAGEGRWDGVRGGCGEERANFLADYCCRPDGVPRV